MSGNAAFAIIAAVAFVAVAAYLAWRSLETRKRLWSIALRAFGKAFVSYRRADASETVYRLVRDLQGQFGDGSIFQDAKDIDPGDPIDERILSTLRRCDLLIAVIDKDWETICRDGSTTPRLREENDWVCRELTLAHESSIHVLPVLVEGRAMPLPESLPEDLRWITSLNALPLRHDERYDDDYKRIAATITKHAAASPVVEEAIRADRSSSLATLASSALVAAAMAAGITYWLVTLKSEMTAQAAESREAVARVELRVESTESSVETLAEEQASVQGSIADLADRFENDRKRLPLELQELASSLESGSSSTVFPAEGASKVLGYRFISDGRLIEANESSKQLILLPDEGSSARMILFTEQNPKTFERAHRILQDHPGEDGVHVRIVGEFITADKSRDGLWRFTGKAYEIFRLAGPASPTDD